MLQYENNRWIGTQSDSPRHTRIFKIIFKVIFHTTYAGYIRRIIFSSKQPVTKPVVYEE